MEESNEIGTILKQAREAKEISLRDVAQKTKININILRALEDNDLEKLPNITYVKGFVKNYAKTIKFDQKTALQALERTFQKHHEAMNPPTEDTEQEDAENSSQSLFETKEPLPNPSDLDVETDELKETLISFSQSLFNKKVILSLGVLVIIVTVVKVSIDWIGQITDETVAQINPEATKEKIVKVETDNVLKPADKNILEMDANKKFAKEILEEQKKKEEAQKAFESKKTVVTVAKKEPEKPKPVEKVEPVEQEKPVEKVDTASVDKKEEIEKEKNEEPLAPGKLPYRRFSPAPENLYSLNSESPELNDASLLPPSIRNSVIEGKQNVYVVADEGDTWLSYQSDDNPIKRFVLRKGRRVLIRGDKILLFIGNYNGAKVFYNNQFVVAQTKSGVKSLIFPPSATKDHVLPLFPSYKGIPYKAAEYMEKMEQKNI